MRYQPVKILHVTQVIFDVGQPHRIQYHNNRIEYPNGQPVPEDRQKSFWQVRSNRFGNCGHEHATEAEAQPCVETMKSQWSAWRSSQSKSARQRKLQSTT